MKRKILGIFLLVFVITVLFIFMAHYSGLKNALIAFGLGLSLTAISVIAAWLIAGGE